MMIPPLSPFMYGVLVGCEAAELTLSVIAPYEIRSDPVLLGQFNRGVIMGYRLTHILNG